MKTGFDAVLFDLDGTILDTTEYILRAYQHSFKRNLKKEISWKELVPAMGLSLIECYRRLTGLQ
jgi:phosphoglycolate phosphatase-like HAD superfamily hydrolase